MPQPVRAVRNQYRGVNAHLHSFWQAEGGWRWGSFHGGYITLLTLSLQQDLLPLGYIARNEPSLQIRHAGLKIGMPEADIAIYDKLSRTVLPTPAASSLVAGEYAEGVAVSPVELLSVFADEPRDYFAVKIYETMPRFQDPGEPVAWIELLSPTNKPPSSDASVYLHKRDQLIHSGVVFVEIDLLHETLPTFNHIAPYRPSHAGWAADAQPYRSVVIDPRPELNSGKGHVYAFGVDAGFSKVIIPLNGTDQVRMDLSAPYEQLFTGMYYGSEVNYAALPDHFERYSPTDQARIAARMVAVLEAAARGVDLEANAPLPVEPLPLQEGLGRLSALGVVVSTSTQL